MTHRGPFQPLLFCDSVILSPWGLREVSSRWSMAGSSIHSQDECHSPSTELSRARGTAHHGSPRPFRCTPGSAERPEVTKEQQGGRLFAGGAQPRPRGRAHAAGEAEQDISG